MSAPRWMRRSSRAWPRSSSSAHGAAGGASMASAGTSSVWGGTPRATQILAKSRSVRCRRRRRLPAPDALEVESDFLCELALGQAALGAAVTECLSVDHESWCTGRPSVRSQREGWTCRSALRPWTRMSRSLLASFCGRGDTGQDEGRAVLLPPGDKAQKAPLPKKPRSGSSCDILAQSPRTPAGPADARSASHRSAGSSPASGNDSLKAWLRQDTRVPPCVSVPPGRLPSRSSHPGPDRAGACDFRCRS
jgi:hypothetical protein